MNEKLFSNNFWLACFCETKNSLSQKRKIQDCLVFYITRS